MSEDKAAVLERDLAAKAEHASAISGQLEAQKKELGQLRKDVAQVAVLKEEKAVLQAALDQANGQIKTLEAGLKKAGEAVAAGEKAVAAGKAISDGLAQLAAL